MTPNCHTVRPRAGRDHDGIMQDAAHYCAEHSLRLTKGRKQVLSLIAGDSHSVKAYDLLTTLTAPGQKLMPPAVYRALDFWTRHGFIHRIESMNAFVACGHPLHNNGCQLLICTKCGRVLEVCNDVLHETFRATAGHHGFSFDRAVLEICGCCPNCATRRDQ